MTISNYFIISVSIVCLVSCQNEEKPYSSYYPNGVLEWKGAFQNGNKIGDWNRYDSLGNVWMLHRYENDTLVYREIYKKKKLFSKEHLKGENFKHGNTYVYFSNGALESMTNYVDNRQFGDQVTYFENGQVRIKYFKDSVDMKNFKQYFPNGKLFVESDNPNNGVVTFYDSLGNRKFDVRYINSLALDTLNVY
ncbi:MAG: hypothetical protein GY816_19060 [Cytophagales bacterium]|nr:hypothetical protein [Cytophagales bacterium]